MNLYDGYDGVHSASAQGRAERSWRWLRLGIGLATLIVWLSSDRVRATPIHYELVLVGNAGNPNDSTGYGGVTYDYQIGKYEVTLNQYTTFLNAVASTDPYDLYDPGMVGNSVLSASGSRATSGISRSGTPGSYTYSVIGPAGSAYAQSAGNRPFAFATWHRAARFANWMHNGMPVGVQGPATTESGAYELNGLTTGPATPRSPNALYGLPTENEWYKAAFYDPSLNNGQGGYWAFATRSNALPGNAVGNLPNQVNWAPNFSGSPGALYSLTQGYQLLPDQNFLTDVGAFVNSGSAYGTFDQNGNVMEWIHVSNDAGATRGIRGGAWGTSGQSTSSGLGLASAYRIRIDPTQEAWMIQDGFRLVAPVAVPEPAFAGIGVVVAALAVWRLRR